MIETTEDKGPFRFEIAESHGDDLPCRCAVCDANADAPYTMVRYSFLYKNEWLVFATVNLCTLCGADEDTIQPFAEVRNEQLLKPDIWSRAFAFGVETPRGRHLDEPPVCPKCGTWHAFYKHDRKGNRTHIWCEICHEWSEPLGVTADEQLPDFDQTLVDWRSLRQRDPRERIEQAGAVANYAAMAVANSFGGYTSRTYLMVDKARDFLIEALALFDAEKEDHD